ncbi:type II secretion system major pseudopilin GspG [Ruficoccus amylovorans]|uniref:Type II secretion system major pseudopilin GspG n=1 Tax=Ruficoccus amylovorans TaxID=1804625 RepID=A0A842HAR5_9BACT|nr:type II secretion system major pseudopilin GspG [Ruficoccus amylovorans]MBC2592727.1 type II secretion system major pseudopilin GspG [Ruficoccus amylovorans]
MTNNRISSSALGGLCRKVRRGFTLIEILIVIALIAMLAGASIVALDQLFGGGQESIAQTFVETTGPTALMAYRLNMGGYPTTEQGLAVLRTAPANAGSRWKGPYLKKEPLDPWGNPYQYRQPGTHNENGYDLWSLGADGKEGSDDIGNWEN